MYYKEFYLKNSDCFLTVGLHDLEDLKLNGKRKEQNVAVELDALGCLSYITDIKRLILLPGEIDIEHLDNLEIPSLESLKLEYYNDIVDQHTIDLSTFPNLKYLVAKNELCFKNADVCRDLYSINVYEWISDDLTHLGSNQARELSIAVGRLKSINGIQNLLALKSLCISYQKRLKNIDLLGHCLQLERLSIESCNRIDIESLPSLQNLRFLELKGTQNITSLDFLARFPHLNALVMDICVDNGDLSCLDCLDLAVVLKDCRHYNRRNADLPKNWNWESTST